MTSESDRILAPVPGVQVEAVEGECLVFHPEHARAVYLNPSAALIWGLCDGLRPVREVCRMIRESYPDAPESLPEDVTATLAQLEEYRILVVA
jgi:hypothetical protein